MICQFNFIPGNGHWQTGNYLPANLMGSVQLPIKQHITNSEAILNPDKFEPWVAIIMPNNQLLVNQTLDFVTKGMNAANYAPINKPFIAKCEQISEEPYYLVISWMQKGLLEKNWEKIANFLPNYSVTIVKKRSPFSMLII